MTAAQKPTETEMDRLLRRLRYAAQDLEAAAQSADDAIASLSRDDPDDDSAASQAVAAKDRLTEELRAWHETDHAMPLRWCDHPACRALAYAVGERA